MNKSEGIIRDVSTVLDSDINTEILSIALPQLNTDMGKLDCYPDQGRSYLLKARKCGNKV